MEDDARKIALLRLLDASSVHCLYNTD